MELQSNRERRLESPTRLKCNVLQRGVQATMTVGHRDLTFSGSQENHSGECGLKRTVVEEDLQYMLREDSPRKGA